MIWQQQFGTSTETRFEFNLEGVVSLPIVAATSGILPFDEALLGRFAEDGLEPSVVEPIVVEAVVIRSFAEDRYAAFDTTEGSASPSRDREDRNEREQDHSLVDVVFDQLGDS